MNLDFDYEKEMEKLNQKKLEWEKQKREQEARLKQEKEILMNFQYSYFNQNIYGINLQKKSKYNIIKDLQNEKLEYENKIKELETQIGNIQEERKLFTDYKNECESQLKNQLEEIISKKSELEERKKITDEEYDKVLKRELKYISNFEKIEEKKKIINTLLDEVKRKELENKQKAKNINDIVNNFDIKSNEIEINKKIFEDKFIDIKKEKEKLVKEKKIVEAKKRDLLVRLESINLLGIKLYGQNYGKENEKNIEN